MPFFESRRSDPFSPLSSLFGGQEASGEETFGPRVGLTEEGAGAAEIFSPFRSVGKKKATLSPIAAAIRRELHRAAPKTARQAASEDAPGETSLASTGGLAAEPAAANTDGGRLNAATVFERPEARTTEVFSVAAHRDAARQSAEDAAAAAEKSAHFLSAADVIKAHSLTGSIKQQISGFADSRSDLALALNKLQAHLNPQLLDLADLRDPVWQAEARSRLEHAFFQLSHNGCDTEAVRLFQFLR